MGILLDAADAFSKVTAGIQSIVAAVGIGVGGVWVLYTFSRLKQSRKARAEIAALERGAVREPVLNIEVTPVVLSPDLHGMRVISVSVALRNDGTRNVAWYDPELWITPIEIRPTELIASPATKAKLFTIKPRMKLSRSDARFLRRGQSRTIVFLAPTSSHGPHVVEFHATYSGAKYVATVGTTSTGKKIVHRQFAPAGIEIAAWQQRVVEVTQRVGSA